MTISNHKENLLIQQEFSPLQFIFPFFCVEETKTLSSTTRSERERSGEGEMFLQFRVDNLSYQKSKARKTEIISFNALSSLFSSRNLANEITRRKHIVKFNFTSSADFFLLSWALIKNIFFFSAAGKIMFLMMLLEKEKGEKFKESCTSLWMCVGALMLMQVLRSFFY